MRGNLHCTISPSSVLPTSLMKLCRLEKGRKKRSAVSLVFSCANAIVVMAFRIKQADTTACPAQNAREPYSIVPFLSSRLGENRFFSFARVSTIYVCIRTRYEHVVCIHKHVCAELNRCEHGSREEG